MRFVDVTMFYTAESGGVRTYLTAKANWLARRTNIEHIVVAPDQIEAKGARFIGVPSLPIPYANGYRMPLSCRIAARKIQQLRPDLIEVGDPYQLAWAALRVRDRTAVPVVGFCHSDLPRLIAHRFGSSAQRVAARYIRTLYRHFDLVLAPSRTMMDRLCDIGITQVRHQPLGVDTRIFRPARRNPALRRQLGLPPESRLLIYAGRFTHEKKLPLLLDAMRRLGSPYHLVMVGSGARLPAASRVTYLPFQGEAGALAELIASCDVLVHPGDQETFGLVVLEAMACGIPVVGANAGGISELIDEQTGILVRPGSASALAEGISRAYEADIGVLGRQARRKVLKCYDWNSVIPQLLHQYAGLVGAQRSIELGIGTLYAPD